MAAIVDAVVWLKRLDQQPPVHLPEHLDVADGVEPEVGRDALLTISTSVAVVDREVPRHLAVEVRQTALG